MTNTPIPLGVSFEEAVAVDRRAEAPPDRATAADRLTTRLTNLTPELSTPAVADRTEPCTCTTYLQIIILLLASTRLYTS